MKRKSLVLLIAAVVIIAVLIVGAISTAGASTEEGVSNMYGTFWALVPPSLPSLWHSSPKRSIPPCLSALSSAL